MQHLRRALALAPLALVGFTSVPAVASVLKVAPTGAPYTQIQSAVNAAVDGDVILVSPGTYGGVSINAKSLTVCAVSQNTVLILGETRVTGLSSTQNVVLSGLKGIAPMTPAGGIGLSVTNNLGGVRVEYCAFSGSDGLGDGFGVTVGGCCWPPPDGAGRPGAYVDANAAGVSFTACELLGGRAADSNLAQFVCYCGTSSTGGAGIYVRSTLVSLYDCTLRGGRGGHNGGEGGRGGPACTVSNGAPISAVCSSGSTFRGGKGGDGVDAISGYPGRGGDGLYLHPGTSARLLDNTFVPGLPGFSWGWAGYSGVNITGGGAVHTDTESRIVMTTDRSARAGSVIDIRIQGAPGQNITLMLSRSPTFQILPSWHGTLLSLPGKGSVEIPLGPIPANGVLQTRYTAPRLPPGVASTPAYVQAFRDDLVLGPKLTAGTCVTLVP